MPRAQTIRSAVEVASKIFNCMDVGTYGILRIITTLEILQHHFFQMGHGNTSCDPHLHPSHQATNARSPHAQRPPPGGYVLTRLPPKWVPVPKFTQAETSSRSGLTRGLETFTTRDETCGGRNGVSFADTEGAMNRRKFMKQSLVVGVAASGALRLDAGKAFAEDAPTGGGRSATLAAKPTPISLDLAKTVVMVVDMQND